MADTDIIRTGQIYSKEGAKSSLLAGDPYGAVLARPAGGALQAACEAGRLYTVASQAAVATTAALATTWTGLGVANPTTSTVNLVFHEFGWAHAVVGSDDGAVGLMIATYASGFTAAVTILNCLRGSSNTSQALADDGATIATPVLIRICGTHGMGATTTQISAPPQVVDLKGGIILKPGYCICNYTTTATTAGLLFHYVWEEVPI